MIAHTTMTLGSKLAKGLDIGLKQVAITSGDYLLGKLKEKGYLSDEGAPGYGFAERLPAMAIIKNNLAINKENVPRVSPLRTKGITVGVDELLGQATVVKILPVVVTYDISVLFADSDDMDRAEINLLWWLEDGSKTMLPIKVEINGIDCVFPVTVRPSSFSNVSLSTNRLYNWDGAKMYRTDISLEASTFVIKQDLKPIIKTINFAIFDWQGITMVEEIIEKAD